MKTKELQELVKKNTNEEGIVNFEEVSKEINNSINAISEKNIEKEQSKIKDSVINDFLKVKGFENVDQYDAFVKNGKATTDENKEALLRLTAELDKAKQEKTTLQTSFEEANGKLKVIDNQKIAKSLGVKEDMIEFALFKAQQTVSDDKPLEEVLKGLQESNQELFDVKEDGDKTFIKVGANPSKGEKPPIKSEFEIAFENQKKRGY